MILPNWLRCFAYPTDASSIAWPAPTSCAAVASTPNSKALAVSAFCASPGRRRRRTACGRVDGLVPVARRAVAHLAVPRDQDQPGGVGVDGPRDVRWQGDGGDQLTGRERTAALVVGQQHRCHRDGFGDRAGHAPVPESFGGDHEVHRVCVDAVEPFSGTTSAVTPRSASVDQTLRPGPVSPAAHARTARGHVGGARAPRRCSRRSRAAVRRDRTSFGLSLGLREADQAAARR